jgi:hypothetical protein
LFDSALTLIGEVKPNTCCKLPVAVIARLLTTPLLITLELEVALVLALLVAELLWFILQLARNKTNRIVAVFLINFIIA